MIYLDNSATTCPYEQAVAAMNTAFAQNFGNPSSVHRLGIRAEEAVGAAREQLAQTLGCRPAELFFTSGGTEADNLALLGAAAARKRRGNRIVTTDGEHPAVLEPVKALEAQGFEVIRLSTRGGCISREELFEAVNEKTILVSMMMVNNETGALFPVRLAREAIDRVGAPALLHCDCVQSYLKVPFSVLSCGADLMTLSSHKVHGPKGVGALYLRSGVRILPPYLGGGQEKGIRSGTENVPGIVGFGEAARCFWENREENYARLTALGEFACRRLSQIPGVTLNLPKEKAPHIVSVTVGTVRSEVVLRELESREIYVSAGSACASHKKNSRSHVLTAMGLAPGQVDSTIRVSLSHTNTEQELEQLAQALEQCLAARAGSKG